MLVSVQHISQFLQYGQRSFRDKGIAVESTCLEIIRGRPWPSTAINNLSQLDFYQGNNVLMKNTVY